MGTSDGHCLQQALSGLHHMLPRTGGAAGAQVPQPPELDCLPDILRRVYGVGLLSLSPFPQPPSPGAWGTAQLALRPALEVLTGAPLLSCLLPGGRNRRWGSTARTVRRGLALPRDGVPLPLQPPLGSPTAPAGLAPPRPPCTFLCWAQPVPESPLEGGVALQTPPMMAGITGHGWPLLGGEGRGGDAGREPWCSARVEGRGLAKQAQSWTQ